MSDKKLQAIIQSAPCTRAYDASYHLRWFFLDEQNMALACDTPELAEITVEILFGYMVLRAPGMLRLDIPMDVLEDDEEAFEMVNLTPEHQVRAVTEGDLACAWLSTFFQKTVRLMKLHPDEPSPSI